MKRLVGFVSLTALCVACDGDEAAYIPTTPRPPKIRVVGPIGAFTTWEADLAEGVTFTVTLTERPTTDLVVPVRVEGDEGITSTDQLVFTATDFGAKTFVLRGADDVVRDGMQPSTLVVGDPELPMGSFRFPFENIDDDVFSVELAFEGDGEGTVVRRPGDLACTTSCTFARSSDPVRFVATAAPGSRLGNLGDTRSELGETAEIELAPDNFPSTVPVTFVKDWIAQLASITPVPGAREEHAVATAQLGTHLVTAGRFEHGGVTEPTLATLDLETGAEVHRVRFAVIGDAALTAMVPTDDEVVVAGWVEGTLAVDDMSFQTSPGSRAAILVRLDPRTGALRWGHILPWASGSVTALAIDGLEIFACGDEGSIHRFTPGGDEGTSYALASPNACAEVVLTDDLAIASLLGGGLEARRRSDGELAWTRASAPIDSPTLTPAGLAVLEHNSEEDDALRLIDLATGDELAVAVRFGSLADGSSLVLTPAGELLLLADTGPFRRSSFRRYDATTLALLGEQTPYGLTVLLPRLMVLGGGVWLRGTSWFSGDVFTGYPKVAPSAVYYARLR
jgi:hypothetical protein